MTFQPELTEDGSFEETGGGAPAALSVAPLDVINSTTNASTYAGIAVSPPANRLLIAVVHANGGSAGNTTLSAYGGYGLTWTLISGPNIIDSAGSVTGDIWILAANSGVAPASTAFNVTFAASRQGCHTSIFSVDGADTSGGLASAFVQIVPQAQTVAGLTGTLTLASEASASNRAFAFFATEAAVETLPGAGFTIIHGGAAGNFNTTGPNVSALMEWRSDAFDTTADATWATSNLWGGISFELKAGVAAPTPATGTVANTLPKLTQSVTASTTVPSNTATIANTLPKLTQSVTATVPVTGGVDPWGIVAARSAIVKPVGAVTITAGTHDPQTVINANPAGTTYWFDGLFDVTTRIVPKSGDTLLTNNAVLDGGAYWVTGDRFTDGSTFAGCDIGLDPKNGTGTPSDPRTGVTMKGFEIRNFTNNGIRLWLGSVVQYCLIHDCYVNGVGGGYQNIQWAPGGTLARQSTVTDSIIWDCSAVVNLGISGAGMKFARTGDGDDISVGTVVRASTPNAGVRLARLYAWRNVGNGIWFDICAGGDLVEDCIADGNTRKGFFAQEISVGPSTIQDCTTRNNATWQGEAPRTSSDWGFNVMTSLNVTYQRIRCENNGDDNGFKVDQDGRTGIVGHITDNILIQDINLLGGDVAFIAGSVTGTVTQNNVGTFGPTTYGASYDGIFDPSIVPQPPAPGGPVTGTIASTLPKLSQFASGIGGAAAAAMVVTPYDVINSSSNTTNYFGILGTPPANKLIIAAIHATGGAAGNTTITALTGYGLSWTLIAGPTVIDSAGSVTGDVWLYAADTGGSPSSATFGVTFAASRTGCHASIFLVDAADTSGGIASTFVQVLPQAQTSQALTGTLTLPLPAADPDNRAFGFFIAETTGAVTPGAGFTAIDGGVAGEFDTTGPNTAALTEWRSDSFDSTVDASWATTVLWGGIAFELKSGVAAPTPAIGTIASTLPKLTTAVNVNVAVASNTATITSALPKLRTALTATGGSTARFTVLTRSGEDWLINGVAVNAGRPSGVGVLINARMVQALFDCHDGDADLFKYPGETAWVRPRDPDRNTNELIAMLPTYRAKGLRMLTLCMQGGAVKAKLAGGWIIGTKAISGWLPDGTLRPEWEDRLIRLCTAADQNGIIVCVQALYHNRDDVIVTDTDVMKAFRKLIDVILGNNFTNVLLELSNELTDANTAHPGIMTEANLVSTYATLRSYVSTTHPGKTLLMSHSKPGNSLPATGLNSSLDFFSIHTNGETADTVRSICLTARNRGLTIPIMITEDNNEPPFENFTAAIVDRDSSWGYYDQGLAGPTDVEGGDYNSGYQTPPVNWGITTARKIEFFNMAEAIAGQVGNPATIASPLPKLTQVAFASTGTGNTGSIGSTLPKLTQSAFASTGVGNIGSATSTLRALTQLATVHNGTLGNTAAIASPLPRVTTAATMFNGTLGTALVTSMLPEPTQAATAFVGGGAPKVGTITSLLPSLSQNLSTTVDSPPIPPTPPSAQGLVHIFKKGATSRLLPATNSPLQVVGGFQDRASMVGGFMSATGEISEEEYNAHPNEYSVGTTWLVKSVALEEAGRPPFIFAGELKQSEEAEGKVKLAADGWGLLADRQVERFLLASGAVDQWVPGDTKPHNFPGQARIHAEVKTRNIVFEIKRNAHFRRNDAGQPDKWRSHPMVFWAPKTDLRWIKLTISASGRHTGVYDLELVGTPTGPTGNLTVLRTWNITNTTVDEVKEDFIPAGYDLIGLRVVRSVQAKEAPHVRIVVSDVMVGGYAQNDPYTITQAFTTLFGVMGTNTIQVASAAQNVLPYDAARASLAEIADDLGVLGQWYWRLWANAVGAKQGEAGPVGQTSWSVSLVHTPVRPLPSVRYNVVQYDYKYGGGYTSQDSVRASPDPYPGTDIVYVLDLGDPPVQVLAQGLAQQVANIVSKPWMSGSGTLYKVEPGNLPAAVVKPGDKLTLTNYDNVEVVVDEITHSEDGALVEVQFADSSKIIDRWLARWQQKINQGLSPNAAALELLHVNRPKPPNVSAAFTVSQKKEGRKDFDLVAIASLVTEDIEGEGTFVKRYEFRARPVDPQSNNPIPEAQGGGWRERHMRSPGDDEAEETKSVVWDKIQNPHKWAWQVQGWAVDALGQKSLRDEEFPGKPAAFQPVTPQSVSLDVDQRVMTVTHILPPDPDDPTEEDQTYDHAIIKINDQNGNWNSPMKQDRKVKGETKRFRFHKPIDGHVYWAQVTYVDFWGNKSTPVVASNSKKVPPTPLIGSPNFDANGSRHARYRLRVPVTVADAGHDDHVKRILVQMCHKTVNNQPDVNDKKVRDWVRINDDPQEALFRNIPKTHFVFVRAMSVDSDQKESGWSSPWVALGKPKDSGATTTPLPPTWQGVANVDVKTPTPRRVVVNWDDPDDDEATRWRVVIKKGAATVDTIRTRNTRAVYRVPKADVGANHTAEVYAMNDVGGESAAATGSGIPTDDDAGLPPPPDQPANPILSFDVQGTRHGRYRAIVTAGLSTTGEPPHRYVIQLAHTAITGTPPANPPAGVKRQHGSVEGDAVGDDLQEVFRNIPKAHHVWVRERARNAGGASNWTGWSNPQRPRDSGATSTPNAPTWNAVLGVDVTAPAPRRCVAKWDDPDDDEVTRWRVVWRRGATIVDTQRVRNPRSIYRVPKPDVGQNHTAEVFAINDLAVDSPTSGQFTAVPTDDAVVGGVGNPPNVPTNPSFTADGQGTRHSKYRIIVTAGTSTPLTDATHDAPHHYVIQLVHSATDTGANPPAGVRRQHGRVEGDAAAGELDEVFRNIPKRHHVWVRQRARNAAGPSAWTGWRTSSRPIDFGVAVAPNPPVNVQVTTPTDRRVKVTWNDPDDDETVRWRVEIRRGGGTVETGHTRTNRYVYHVPKQFVNVTHNARVFAISDTGTDSSQQDSNDGLPFDTVGEGHVVGDIVPRGHAAVPVNWLLCDGANNIPISAYPALFALYGTMHGGDGVNTFGVPDIRGRHPAGVGTNIAISGPNSDEGDAEPNRSSVNVIDPDGTEATPTDDNTETQPDQDGTPGDGGQGDKFENPPTDQTNETADHTHGAQGLGMSGPGATVGRTGTTSEAAGPQHTHNIQGSTGSRQATHPHPHGSTHGHGHGHGHNPHPHPHGHNKHKHGHGHGKHPHPHPHNNKKRAHKGMHWIVKAA